MSRNGSVDHTGTVRLNTKELPYQSRVPFLFLYAIYKVLNSSSFSSVLKKGLLYVWRWGRGCPENSLPNLSSSIVKLYHVLCISDFPWVLFACGVRFKSSLALWVAFWLPRHNVSHVSSLNKHALVFLWNQFLWTGGLYRDIYLIMLICVCHT